MSVSAGSGRVAGWIVAITLSGTWLAGASAQSEFITGTAAETWTTWQAAMDAFLMRDEDAQDARETAFGNVLALDPSAFRIALMADRTVRTGIQAGAILLLEQDIEAGSLGANASRIGDLLLAGREQMNQADDGWYFASIGRFDIAAANFNALVAGNPDPVALLEMADQVKQRHQILLQLIDHPDIGESAHALIRLLARGESMIKSDPLRIKANLDRLGGPPRAFENAVSALKDSGEYAVPFIIQYLRSPDKKPLLRALLRVLPLIDRPGLNPMVLGLSVGDKTTQRYLIDALGKIGYVQSVPYLVKLRDAGSTPAEVRAAVEASLAALKSKGVDFDANADAATLFQQLAEAYYYDRGSLAADTTLDEANVWYWRDDLMQNVPVPTYVFNEIMTMRCCEEALLLDPGKSEAIALWLAANFRREAQLADGQTDATRHANYPTAAYFAQSGGAEYALLALARGIRDGDPAVALGVIEALRKTAGRASLVGRQAATLPLAEALSFPHRMVRIRAGLALGQANPRETFANSQNLMPVLGEALMLHGGSRNALVVDPDAESANAVAGILRGEGYTVLTDGGLLSGLQKVRGDLPSIDVLFVGSDIRDPGLSEGLKSLRAEFAFAAVPVVIINKPADRETVRNLVQSDHRLTDIMPGADSAALVSAVEHVSGAVGLEMITAELGDTIALEAAGTLKTLARTDTPTFDLSRVQAALISVIENTQDPMLRVSVAEVLGYLGSQSAQESIAKIALDAGVDKDMRAAMFAALGEAAKRRGNMLSDDSINAIIKIVEGEDDIRDAASRALGALNLPGNKAGDLIRNQHRG